MGKTKTVAAILLATVGVGAAWAAGGWDDAKNKADEAKRKGEEVQKVLPTAMKKIVGAMCAAGDDDRARVGESEASNGRSALRDKLDAFHRTTKDALERLERMSNDYKDAHHSDASSLVSELKSRRDKLDDLSRALENKPPVIDYIIRHGDSARSDHTSRCNERSLSLDGGRVSCLINGSDTCTVVEIAFDNSTSISKARDRASRAKESVEHELKRQQPNSAVAKCKRVETRVDCYKLCPDVDDNGKFRESSASWRERC
jgi:hypothetical protein